MRLRIPQNFQVVDNGLQPLRLSSGDGSLVVVHVLEDNLVRVQHIPPNKNPLETTHAVCPGFNATANGMDSIHGLERSSVQCRFRCPVPSVTTKPSSPGLLLTTNQLQISVDLTDGDLALSWTAQTGKSTETCKPFLQDLPFRAYEYDLDGSVHHYVRHSSTMHYYGAGEHSSPLSLTGKHIRIAATDALGYNPELSDPLYKHFPVYYGLDSTTSTAYGVYYDSLGTGSLDFGCEIDAIWGSFTSYRTCNPTLDYYVFFGPTLDQCVQTFASIVGLPALIPRYALGYLASSMGYAEAENAQELIEAFPKLCRKWDIPCDVLHLSSGYTVNQLTHARNVFTWNSERFPDPDRMFRVLRESGIRTVANVKPWLLAGHPHYDQVHKLLGFVWDPEKNSPSMTRLWSAGAGSTATGSYLDFSSKSGRDYWKAGVKALLQVGVEGIWNDNNEFELHDDQHTYSMMGKANVTVGTGGRALQTMLMGLASYEAMREFQPTKRPFLITRSSGPGAHRFACQTWSGDNYSSWQTLKHNIPMGLNAGLCLMAGYGHDVGGFVGPRPEKELFVRWVQNGIFHPRFCIHSWKEQGITEPWMYPDVTHIIRDAIQFRYRLIPYLYSLHYKASTTGVPVIRPLVYHFQNDSNVHQASFEFMLGPSLLVASVFVYGATEREVYLPFLSKDQGRWCNVWTGEWMNGGQTVVVPVPLDQHGALFAPSGALIPMDNSMHKINTQSQSVRTVEIYMDPQSRASSDFIEVIDDDGVSMDAAVFRYRMRAENTVNEEVHIHLEVLECAYIPEYTTIEFMLSLNDQRCIVTTETNGNTLRSSPRQSDGRQSVFVPLEFSCLS
ncbi:hypothetical protein MT418_000253 [Batrachochytrium dendrobatidis]